MAIVTDFKGVDEIMKNFAKVKTNLAQKTEDGLTIAGLFVQRKSMELVPIDTNNLRIGAFTRKFGKGFDAIVTIGYVAAYAVFVHENLTAKHAPGKQAKFLEQPVREFKDQILKIIKGEVGEAI